MSVGPFSNSLHVFFHAALSLHHPHITVLTGSEFLCGTHILLLKLTYTTNFSAGSCFQCCCHCKLTFPVNRIWLNLPCLLHIIPLWVLPVCCKSMKYLFKTNVTGHQTLLIEPASRMME
jgi:hypothetical protein